MAWMPEIPHDQGACPQGNLNPIGVVAHRTYGSWNGDYSVGKGSNPPIGFHFLVGKAQDKWVQFYDTTTRCAHAGTNANGNDISIGIEVEGRNDEPLTDWQLWAVGRIVDWLELTHNIQPVYRFSTAHDLKADYGYIPHSAVKGADHSDYWTIDDWSKIGNEDDMASAEEIAAAVWSFRIGNYDAHAWLTSIDHKAEISPAATINHKIPIDDTNRDFWTLVVEILERVRELERTVTQLRNQVNDQSK